MPYVNPIKNVNIYDSTFNKLQNIFCKNTVTLITQMYFFSTAMMFLNYRLSCCLFAYLTLSLSVTRCAGHNTDLPSNSNISKNGDSKHCQRLFLRACDKFANDIQVDRLCTCGSLVIDV